MSIDPQCKHDLLIPASLLALSVFQKLIIELSNFMGPFQHLTGCRYLWPGLHVLKKFFLCGNLAGGYAA